MNLGADMFVAIWVNYQNLSNIWVAALEGGDAGEALSRLRVDEVVPLINKVDAV